MNYEEYIASIVAHLESDESPIEALCARYQFRLNHPKLRHRKALPTSSQALRRPLRRSTFLESAQIKPK